MRFLAFFSEFSLFGGVVSPQSSPKVTKRIVEVLSYIYIPLLDRAGHFWYSGSVSPKWSFWPKIDHFWKSWAKVQKLNEMSPKLILSDTKHFWWCFGVFANFLGLTFITLAF